MSALTSKGRWINSTRAWADRTCSHKADPDAREALTGPSAEPEETAGDPFSQYADPSPLRNDRSGVVRVGESRVSLDVVVEQYESGMTAEEIVQAYETLQLDDVRATIHYYLWHRDEVRAYLGQREQQAEALRGRIEAERPRISREQLLARRRARGTDNAPAGQ